MSQAARLCTALRAALLPPHTAWQAREGQLDAAVVVPLVVRDDDVALLFIKRHGDLRHHAGQYAFPGGRRDADETPVACARRELEEELGLPGADVDVLGSLPCHGSSAGFLVHPFVGWLAPTIDLRPQAREVELVLEVPVAALRQADRWEWRTVASPAGPRQSPFFTHGEHVIWGLTARVAADLVALWP